MSYILLEYTCGSCGLRVESLESRSSPSPSVSCPCPSCPGTAERVISAPKVGTVWATAVTRGKSDERPSPGYLDTRGMADGQTRREWKAERRKYRSDQRRAEIRREFG